MAEELKSAQEELRDAVWSWVQRLVVAGVLFGGGILAAYFAWGDAAELRQHNKELQDQIVDLKNQRETLNTRIAREARDKEVCNRDLVDVQKQLSDMKGGAAPAAPAAVPGTQG